MKAAEHTERCGGHPLVAAFGILTAGLAAVALLGWILGLPRLASFKAELIPMAPSTAVLFLMYGVALGLRVRKPLSRRTFRVSVAAGCLGALAALLLFVLSCGHIHWSAEHLGLDITGTVGGAAIGYMSPVTATCFLLASGSFLASLSWSATQPWRANLALVAAGVLLGTCYIFLLAYFFGTPLLYGGKFIPPALTTLLAFVTMGLALLALAGQMRGRFLRLPGGDSGPVFVFVLTFLLLALGIIGTGYIYYLAQKQHFRGEFERELSAVADLKVSELAQWRQEHLADGAIFFKNPSFAALVRRCCEKPEDADARHQFQDWLGKYPTLADYDQISLLDTQGVTRLSFPAGQPLLPSVVSQRAAELLRSGQMAFQDFFRHEANQHNYLTVLVPIFDEVNASRPLGVLVLRIEPQTFLYPFIKRWPTTSQTAETLLIRRDGNEAVFLNELRFQTNTALTFRVPLDRVAMPSVQAALGREGILEGVDYRGAPVVAALRHIPDSPWMLVARMDTAEMYDPLRERCWQMVVLIGALLLSAGAGVGFAGRQQRVRFYRERAETAEALRESHELFSLFLRHSPIYAYIKQVTPTESRVLHASDNFQQMIGVASAELPGRTMADLFPAEFAAKITADDWAVFCKGEVLRLEEDLNGRNYTSIKFPIVQGARNLMAGYTIDITEQKKLEAQFLRAQRVESFGALASGIAHDLNNLITPILVTAPILREAAQDSESRGLLRTIESCAQHATDIIKQLLTFVRGTPGARVPLSVQHLLRDMGKFIQQTFPCEIHPRVNAAADLWPLLGDATQVHQTLMNLCINARDAMPAGGALTLEARNVTVDAAFAAMTPDAKPGPYVCVSVADTGTGIAPENLDSIFDPFFTTKEIGKGTGLGLASTLHIVRGHGGFLRVDSRLGQGTTFELYFPATPPAEAGKPAGVAASIQRRQGELILVVDDEAAVRESLCYALKSNGYQVVTAAEGGQGRSVFLQHRAEIRAVITDLMMPVVNGPGLIAALRAIEPGVLILGMTGRLERSGGQDVRDLTLAAVLTKPFSGAELLRALDASLPSNSAGADKRGNTKGQKLKR